MEFLVRGATEDDEAGVFMSFEETGTGIQLTDVYIGPSGMLTGSARMAQEGRERAERMSLDEEIERQQLALERKRAALEGQIAALRAEVSVALDKVAMGRSRQHDVVKSNGSPARRNVTGGKQS
jgi:hypothetical protein